jgi:hypothetical protein
LFNANFHLLVTNRHVTAQISSAGNFQSNLKIMKSTTSNSARPSTSSYSKSNVATAFSARQNPATARSASVAPPRSSSIPTQFTNTRSLSLNSQHHKDFQHKIIEEQAQNLGKLSWDDVFDPVAARKKKAIEEQRKILNLPSECKQPLKSQALSRVVTDGG